MRTAVALAALLLPCVAFAETAYSSKFARIEQQAEILHCKKPEWPKASLRNKEQGTVHLRLAVSAIGRLAAAAVERSSGFRDLDKAALDVMSSCRFRPATLNGAPVQSTRKMQFVWILE